MLWGNTDFIDGAVRSRVFCQLYQYDNCVSGRKDAREQRDRGSPLADRATCAPTATRCEIGSVGSVPFKLTLADGMGGALRQSDKVTRLDLADWFIRLQARILVHHQWISAQTDNKLRLTLRITRNAI